jgi:glycogen debranching enzyme
VNGDTPETRSRARRCYFEPLLRHLDRAGLGHISEIADAEPPHTPGGCPFQAWSVGEALRLERIVLAGESQ